MQRRKDNIEYFLSVDSDLYYILHRDFFKISRAFCLVPDYFTGICNGFFWRLGIPLCRDTPWDSSWKSFQEDSRRRKISWLQIKWKASLQENIDDERQK